MVQCITIKKQLNKKSKWTH